MAVNVLIPIAQGTEEMEAVIVIDLLRRANINVKIAGESNIITCSRGVKILPDILIDDINPEDNYHAIVLPGGTIGTQRLNDNPVIEDLLKKLKRKSMKIAAICAAPTILSYHKIIRNDNVITSHPSVKEQLLSHIYVEDKVVVDGNIITSRGAGTAIDFGLKLIEILIDKNAADKVRESIVY
jgi:DJ-1 family protein